MNGEAIFLAQFRRLALWVILAGWLAGAAGRLAAHEIQPAYLELRQTGPETLAALWKVPARDDLIGHLTPRLPAAWKQVGEAAVTRTAEAYVERFNVACPGGPDGAVIGVGGSAAAIADVLVRVVRTDGRAEIFRLTVNHLEQAIAAEPSRLGQAWAFLSLGVEHILKGVDHLLFVLGLLLIVRDRWMLLKTITAFTVAHSLTLAIATLGYARAPLPPLNAAIALSILFLGPEMVRVRRGQTSLTIAHPWVVAFAFGLLHGFGFASGLTALGLARNEIPLALLLFNVGVELGQLCFVALILLLARSFRTLEIRWARWAEALPAYTVGGLGAYWTIQRTVVLLAALR